MQAKPPRVSYVQPSDIKDEAMLKELDRCARIFDPLLPEPLLRVMWDADKAALLDNTAFTQPALFSLEYALARMWQSFGIQPLAAAGHSSRSYS